SHQAVQTHAPAFTATRAVLPVVLACRIARCVSVALPVLLIGRTLQKADTVRSMFALRIVRLTEGASNDALHTRSAFLRSTRVLLGYTFSGWRAGSRDTVGYYHLTHSPGTIIALEFVAVISLFEIGKNQPKSEEKKNHCKKVES
ncbi:hypothetical protein PFISCL1PPCAC_832, partial [Pristionchus fissidentatus]